MLQWPLRATVGRGLCRAVLGAAPFARKTRRASSPVSVAPGRALRRESPGLYGASCLNRGRPLCRGLSGGSVPADGTPFDGLDRGVRVSTARRMEPSWKQAGDGDLQFVFLEGGTGVGKSTLTYKLEKLGYRVVYEGFVDLCRQNPAYPPTSALLTLKWSSALLLHMERAADEHRAGKIKGGVVFFDRSFLTPAVYARGLPVADFMQQIMEEVRGAYAVVTVLCEAEAYATQVRVQGRLFDSAPDEKDVRTSLGETDEGFQQEIVARYSDVAGCMHVCLRVWGCVHVCMHACMNVGMYGWMYS